MDRNAKKSDELIQASQSLSKKNQSLNLKTSIPLTSFEKQLNSGKKESGQSQKKLKEALIESVEKMNKGKQELREMVEKAKVMGKEIEGMIKEIHTRTGLSFEAMKAHIGNPTNFTEQEWKNIQKRQKEAEKALLKGGTGFSAGSKNAPDGYANDQKRRSKAISARRKWLPMS